MFSIENYDYDLPGELIAQSPVSDRDGSQLLLIDRAREALSDHHFFDLPGLLNPGDLIVVNNTRVISARLFGRKESGGKVEMLVLEHPVPGDRQSDTRWCMLKASKRPKPGSLLFFEKGVSAQVEEFGQGGLAKITFSGPVSLDFLMEEEGSLPLPPYIKRDYKANIHSDMDRERYQTVYSSQRGAVAAPTAGLHFTERLLNNLRKTKISIAELTLHVGHGTFSPVRTQDIRDHKLGDETYNITPETADQINQARAEGRRIIAVGTTVVRTLESAATGEKRITPGKGRTGLLITPGFRFNIVDGLITNFHLPRSSLLFLVSAFTGLKFIQEAYGYAVQRRYRFYSYGDAMLII
jgi:S-adenosylmethionine:tRNA ribosyltransferase-isomerase